jgi:hypothetical protein
MRASRVGLELTADAQSRRTYRSDQLLRGTLAIQSLADEATQRMPRLNQGRCPEQALTTYDSPMPDSIQERLLQSATLYSRRALEAFVTGEFRDFVLFAGIAIEHAAKEGLVLANPVFIAPDRAFPSALALEWARDDVDQLVAGVRTISGAEALTRRSLYEPHLKDVLEPAREIITLRNGEAHLATSDGTQQQRTFVVFLRVIEALLVVDPEDFWHPHYGLVQATLDERAEAVQRQVAEAMAAARIAVETRFAGVEEDYVRAAIAVASTRLAARVDDEYSLVIDCPACEFPAEVLGETDQTSVHVDDDGFAVAPLLTFFASSLRCEVCGLELDGAEQIEAAGLESEWENETIDTDEWLSELYAGEDR